MFSDYNGIRIEINSKEDNQKVHNGFKIQQYISKQSSSFFFNLFVVCYPLQQGSVNFSSRALMGHMVFVTTTQLFVSCCCSKREIIEKYITEWLWLCCNNTLFTNIGGGPHLVQSYSLLTSGLELCCLMVQAGPLHVWVSAEAKQGGRVCRRHTHSVKS